MSMFTQVGLSNHKAGCRKCLQRYCRLYCELRTVYLSVSSMSDHHSVCWMYSKLAVGSLYQKFVHEISNNGQFWSNLC